MPKVSQEYTDARRLQILDAAQRCFLRTGFHETSMQDIFAECGLSSGAVYLYFSGKDALVLELARENLRDVSEVVRRLSRSGTSQAPGQVLSGVLSLMRKKHRQNGFATLLVQIWSEALTDPALGEVFRTLQRELRSEFTEYVREHQAASSMSAHRDPAAVAGALLGSMQGYILQLAMYGPRGVDGMADALASVWTQALSGESAR